MLSVLFSHSPELEAVGFITNITFTFFVQKKAVLYIHPIF